MLLKNSRFTEQSILYLKIAKLQICCCLRLVASFHLEMIHIQFLVYNSDLGYRIKTLKRLFMSLLVTRQGLITIVTLVNFCMLNSR